MQKAFHLPPVSDEQMTSIEDALRVLELERVERIAAARDAETDGEGATSSRFPESRFSAGIPLDTGRTHGARWFK